MRLGQPPRQYYMHSPLFYTFLIYSHLHVCLHYVFFTKLLSLSRLHLLFVPFF